jgi:thioredoxin 1
MGEHTLDVTSATWDSEVLQYKGLVLADFWAAWCGPCKIVGPVIEELAKEYVGKVKVVKVNTDENPDLASQYKIMGIPTLTFIKNGSIEHTLVGAVPKPQIKSQLDALLK